MTEEKGNTSQFKNMKWLKCQKCGAEAKFDKVMVDAIISAKDPAVREDFKFAFKGGVTMVCRKCNLGMIDPNEQKSSIITQDKKIILAK